MNNDLATANPLQFKPGDILIKSSDIEKRLQSLASQIAVDYGKKSFMLVGILKGASTVLADLQRALYNAGCHDFTINFIKVSSYGLKTENTKGPQLIQKLDFDPKNENILIVDDIIDTGLSIQYIEKLLKARKAASIRSFTLLSKPSKRLVKFEPDYIGFIVPDVWIEGYGMDTKEYGRGNPDIIVGSSLNKIE